MPLTWLGQGKAWKSSKLKNQVECPLKTQIYCLQFLQNIYIIWKQFITVYFVFGKLEQKTPTGVKNIYNIYFQNRSLVLLAK